MIKNILTKITKRWPRRKGLPKHVIDIKVWITCHRSSEYSDNAEDPFLNEHEFSREDYALETMWLEYVEQSKSWGIDPVVCANEAEFKDTLKCMGVFEDADYPEIGIYQCCDKTYFIDTKTRALYRFADILGQAHVYHRWAWDKEGRAKVREMGANFG